MSAAWVASWCAASAVVIAGAAVGRGRGARVPLDGPGGELRLHPEAPYRTEAAAQPSQGPRADRADRRNPVGGADRSGVGRAGVAIGVVAVVLAVVVIGPTAAGVAVVALIGGRAVAIGRARARRHLVVDAALPELIELLAVAAAAGHPVRSCVEAVTPRAPHAVRPALSGVSARLARGGSLQDGLRPAAAELGAMGSALVDVLLSAHQSGAPLAPELTRLAATSRDRRRRLAEERARRLPVALLFPLVCCTLPAFALLAVVPLLAASLGSLSP